MLDTDRKEHLGTNLGRNKISMSAETKANLNWVREKLKMPIPKAEKVTYLKKYKSYKSYKGQISKVNQTSES